MDLERFTENILISVNGVHSNENNSLNNFPEITYEYTIFFCYC